MGGILVLPAGAVRDVEHIQITAGLGTLTERVWIDGRRLEGLYGPSMKMWSTDAAIRVGGNLLSGGEGKCGGR